MCKILPRIKKIAEEEGITIGALERSIGASKGVLSRAINNNTDIQAKWLVALVEKYPRYSTKWLISGEGEMLIEAGVAKAYAHSSIPVPVCSDRDFNKATEVIDISNTRPRIPFDAAAGALSVITNSATALDCDRLPVIPLFPSYDFTIFVKGDSMLPDIKSGDELACRLLREASSIKWGETYVVDTADGVVVKNLHPGPGSLIICRSINPKFDDYTVDRSEIYRIARVVGLLRQL